ncbi:MAG: HEAT repeat domain-containing protein, partial [Rhodothermales bacterium]
QLASKHHWHRVREAAANALGNFPHPEAIEALAALLTDSDYAVQCAAATSLGILAKKNQGENRTSTAESTATETLCEVLLKPDAWGLLQTASVVALKNTEDPIAIPTLLTLLKRPDNPAILIDRVLDALVAIGPSTTGSLLSVLNQVDINTQTSISKAFQRLAETQLAGVFPGALYGEEKELDALQALFQAGDIRCLGTVMARVQQLEQPASTMEEIIKQRLIDILKQAQHIKPEVICTQDLTRFISSSQNQLPYYTCRMCGDSYHALRVNKVVVVLQTDAPAHSMDNEAHFRFNWLKQPILIDFDEVEIGDVADEEILRFCVMVGNDTDLFRKTKVRCEIKSSAQLSPNTIRVLHKTFEVNI